MKRHSYEIFITHQARKDIERLNPKLRKKLKRVLEEIIAQDPYEGKKLIGDLFGSYSYRLTLKDRIVYSINASEKIVYIERAKTHYGD